jgi:hypothetical protein
MYHALHEKTPGQTTSPKNHQDTEASNPKKCQKKALGDVTAYEDDDLRGIVAKANAESTDPYLAMLKSGVFKKAAVFFERGAE